MRRSALVFLALVSGALAAPAVAFQASNGLVVSGDGQAIEVPYRGQSGARAFWCAAGEYAERVLNQSPTATLYRVSEPPRRSGEGIVFSLSPDQSARKTGLAVVGAKGGGGISIAHARSLCDRELFLNE
ncbi:hypothetical protein [Oceaniglobus trochenteri]|uniref:hypothetical protein n=1 Tax=Oceaniglobus trochenteri TaxID=2763260 RepID=UPI001CFFA8F0|nr:hypothetical protein [Oceaniglobus trochenteri]